MSSATRPHLDQLLSHRAWAKRLALRLARDEHAANDLVQDAWLAALSNPPERAGLRAWLRSVMRNRAHNVHRESVRRESREARRPSPRQSRSTAEVVAEVDAHRHVVDAVLDLDEPYRTTIVLRYFEELSVHDVARRMDAPLETVRARLRRGRERLRGRLDGEFGGRRAWCIPLLAGWDGLPNAASTASTAIAANPATGGALSGGALAGAAVAVTGGLLMKKLVAALSVLALLAAGGFWMLADDSPDRAIETATEPAEPTPAATPTAESPERRHVAVEDDPTAAAATDVVQPKPALDPVRQAREHYASLPKRRITGRIEDVDGRGIAGAGVRPGGERQMAIGIDGVTTGADGSFEMEVPTDEGGELGPLHLWAVAAGHAMASASFDRDDEHVVVRLPFAVTLRVRVVGADGRPVAGRQVTVHDEGRGGAANWRETTDETGRAELLGLPSGVLVSVRMHSVGRIGDVRRRVQLPTKGSVDVELVDDGQRRVRVNATVTGGDLPISGLLVEGLDGPGEIRSWPGGDSATVEIPGGEVVVALITPTSRGSSVRLDATQDAVDLTVEIPPFRWVEIEVGENPLPYMSFAGLVKGELAILSDLMSFTGGGVLRLPLVEGSEYSLRRMDGSALLLSEHSPDRTGRGEAAPTVAVRCVGPDGAPLPAGATAVAEPSARGPRTSTERAEGARADDGSVTLTLVPGITYDIDVAAPGRRTVRVPHRPGPAGGDVEVELREGGPVRIEIAGLNAGDRLSVIRFPEFERVEATATQAAAEVQGVEDGWLLVMSGTGVYLIDVPTDGVARTVPHRDRVSLKASPASDRERSRTFLIGVAPLADGVHAVGLVGAPFGVPAGTYLPVEWTAEAILVHAPVELTADSPSWAAPSLDEIEWTDGELDGEAATVVVTVDGLELPVATLGAGKVTRWRSAGVPVHLR